MKRLVLAGMLLIAACGEQTGPGEPKPGPQPKEPPVLAAAVVSQPIAVASSLAAVSAGGQVYVSLPPESQPQGRTVTIRNWTTGAQILTEMVNGGWDPVAIGAEAGDTIGLTIASHSGEKLEFVSIVPPRRRPVVVRTQPPPGKRDVPLNATLLVVFSEPMDPATINGGSIRLTRDGVGVPAAVVSTSGLLWSVEVRPEALEPDVTYELTVTTAVASLSTERMESGVTVSFTTEPLPMAPPTGRIAFARPGVGSQHIHVLDLANGIVRQLTIGPQIDADPAWSGDGRRIAFTRDGGIFVMNGDGSGLRRLADGYSPAWSRDSAGRVAFLKRAGGSASITVIDADGSGDPRMITLPAFDIDFGGLSWSSDGRTFAFHASNNTALFPPGMWEEMETALVVNADGSGLRRLTSSCAYSTVTCGEFSAEGWPAWSPDGSRVAFWSWLRGLTVVSPDGGAVVGVTSALWGDRFAWSPDGSWIAHSLGGSLWAFLGRAPWNLGHQLPGTSGGITPSWTSAPAP